MAGKLTLVGAGNALDGALGRVTQTARTVYLMLLTAAPTAASTLASVTEYAATGYARQAIAQAAPTGTPRLSGNSAGLTFGPYTAGTGATITHWAIGSASSGTTGDLIAYGDLAVSKTPGVGDTTTAAIGAFTVTAD